MSDSCSSLMSDLLDGDVMYSASAPFSDAISNPGTVAIDSPVLSFFARHLRHVQPEGFFL